MSFKEKATLDSKIASLYKQLKHMRELIDETEGEIALTRRELDIAISHHDIAMNELERLEEQVANLESGAYI